VGYDGRVLVTHHVPSTDLANPTSNSIYQNVGYSLMYEAHRIGITSAD
jgi:hypothetical protein